MNSSAIRSVGPLSAAIVPRPACRPRARPESVAARALSDL